MRLCALTLVVLVAAWMVPSGGSSCPSMVQGLAKHAHVHSNDPASESHDHALPGHSHGHAAEAAAHSGATQNSASDEPTCCQHASDARAVRAALQDVQPRPKLSIAGLPTLLTVAPLATTSVSGAALRRQPPPLRPYAHTRRPLLI
jgi:ABC-type nickel/cobalt efflux system permease component RcnA